ncbi:MAG TPA: DUF3105 domain-containing protein [Vicinamibacterales bacterium]|nr:DUF3105 domain-containing protein [Vicinamibacterales bacterium]
MAKQRQQRRQEAKTTRATQQAAQARRSERNAWIWRGVIVVLALVVAVVGYRWYQTRDLLKDVKLADYPAGRHLMGHIDYKETPPMGGPHNLVWQNCGVYDVPIHNEHAVHALEHGAIWITYRPDLAKGELDTLKSLAADDFMLLSPYPGLGSPIVASAWNHQLPLRRADDPRLRKFIDEFKNNPETTPEFGAPCAGGTSGAADADTLNVTPRPSGPMPAGPVGPVAGGPGAS